MLPTVRHPAVAGLFYPDSAAILKNDIVQLLSQAESQGIAPKAMIAPHAGYRYSGPIAASAYRLLTSVRDQIKHVVLLGPSHRVPFYGLAASQAEYFATPLGHVRLNTALTQQLIDLELVKPLEAAHAQEHSLEVQIPFLQVILSDFTLLPLVVGEADTDQVATVLNTVWGDAETLIIISSDLSHYHDYDTACQLDQQTSAAIEALQPEAIHDEFACGRNPIKGLLKLAKTKAMQAKTIDLRNSGDIAGSRDRVVGYGAYVFH